MKILFCYNGTRESENAVKFGVKIAVAVQAQPWILGIAEKAGEREALLKDLDRAQDIFRGANLEAEVITRLGSPVSEIVKCAEENHYDLVVIGATRKNVLWRLFDPLWMSVRVYKIIESVEPPVLVVAGSRPALRRILLCTGGAEHIDRAIKFAGEIARSVDAVVDLIHVIPDMPAIYADLLQVEGDVARVLESNSKLGKNLRRQKSLLEELGVFGAIRLRQGDVVQELLKELRGADYDLVVSGSMPAKERLRRYVLGDVAREIVNRVELPVLVIRTGRGMPIAHRLKDLLRRLFGGVRETSEAQTG